MPNGVCSSYAALYSLVVSGVELTGDIAGRVLCSGGLAGARGRLAETGRGGAEGRQGAAGG